MASIRSIRQAAADKPQALVDLLNWWKAHGDEICFDAFGP
jgi:hypothetical protein